MHSAGGMLTCDLEAVNAGGEIALSFGVHNPTAQAITVHYFKPFIGFDLTVWAGKERARVTQPAYDVPAQPQTSTIAPGETVRIGTPIRLRFADPGQPPIVGQPTVWTLEHEPAPVLMHVLLHLEGADVAPCTLQYDATKL